MKRQTAKVSQPRDPAVDESYAVVGAENKLIGIRDLSREPALAWSLDDLESQLQVSQPLRMIGCRPTRCVPPSVLKHRQIDLNRHRLTEW
jgi:hypothetical protein